MENFLDDLHEPKSNLSEIDLFRNIHEMVNRVNEGYENELRAYIFFTEAEKAFKEAKENIVEAAIWERQKYNEKTLEIFGKKISFSQSGRYDYSNSEEHKKLQSKLKDIEENMKAALAAAQKGKSIFDPETGETMPIAIYIPSKLSLKIS